MASGDGASTSELLGVDDQQASTSDLDESSVLSESLNNTSEEIDPELEAIKARVKEMEAEAKKLKEMQNDVEKQMHLSPTQGSFETIFPTLEEKIEADSRSVYVGNVDYGATAEELEQHFHGAGL